MSDLSAKFTTLETQLASQATAIQALVDGVEAALDLINAQLDTQTINNAANTRALLAAIGQNSPCMPCPTPPILIPPIGTTPLPIDEDACKRAQAFIAFMNEVFTVLDLASAVGIGFNPAVITDAINQVIAGLSGGDSPDPISFPEAVQLVGDLVSYIATNLLVGDTLLGLFTPLYSDLKAQLYLSGDAAAAQSAYNAVVDATEMDGYRKAVLKDAAYGAAYTYFFDPASDPDLTGFSGDNCLSPTPPGENCVSILSTYPITTDDAQTLNAIVWPNFGTDTLPASVRPPGYPDIVASGDIWYNGSNLNGYWVRGTAHVGGGAASGRAYLVPDGTVYIVFNGSYQQITVDTSYVAVIGETTALFDFEICAELPE